MDNLTLTFYGIAGILGFIALALSMGFSIHFIRRNLKDRLRWLFIPAVGGFIVLVRSVAFLAAYWPR